MGQNPFFAPPPQNSDENFKKKLILEKINMKESRNREKERKIQRKGSSLNLYIFNEKCTFFIKKIFDEKKSRQNFFRELKGTFKDFFLKYIFKKFLHPNICDPNFCPPIFMTSLRPWA